MKTIYIGTIVANAVMPTAQVATVQQTYTLNDRVPSKLFENHYNQTKEDFLKLVEVGNKVFNDFKMNVEEANAFYETNHEAAIQFISQVNNYLSHRGFWSSLGHAFASIGHAFQTVGAAVTVGLTFGQVPALLDATHDVAVATYEEGTKVDFDELRDGALKITSGVLHIASAIIEPEGAGEALANAVDDFASTTDSSTAMKTVF